MADLPLPAGSGVAPGNNGNGASTARPMIPPQQTGSPGIRGPRMIMRERAEREARQKAEREQMERARAEEEALALEDQRRRMAERRSGGQAAGAVVGGKIGGTGAGAGFEETQADPMLQKRQQRAQEAAKEAAAASSTRQQAPMQQTQPLRATRVPPAQTDPAFSTAIPGGVGQGGTTAQASDTTAAGAPVARVPRNSFPHAFERWEALSAHWEGMTSFWIRKLQENTEELDRNPVSAQLSRQVSDLSAAGANLFHAVVELQRLRASSERKFQRWFFETRAELERNQETNALLQKALEEERQARADAIREAVENDRGKSKVAQLNAEYKKELSIAKEEARRAWEELGRREEEERNRTASLQSGLPTIVGGVQVVPMTQGVPSRQTSARDPQRAQPRGNEPGYASSSQATGVYPDYAQPSQAQPSSSTAAAGVVGSDAQYYQQHAPGASHEGGSHGAGSEGGYSEGEFVIDGQGNYVRDPEGNKIPYRSPDAHAHGRHGSDASVPEDFEPLPASTSYPPSSSQWAQSQDYAGQGYAAPGWETVPRHHHPTRLSDVYEEDEERSRTSASQVSRVAEPR